MSLPDGMKRNVIDGHAHIGEIEAWPFYGIDYPVKPIVYDFPRASRLPQVHGQVRHRAQPVHVQLRHPQARAALLAEPVVMEAATSSDRIRGLLWVSFLPRDREHTMESLKHAGEAGIIGLKTTFLLGGNPNPEEWDEETKAIADMCFDVCEKHDYVFHFHTSAGGNSDINNFIPMVEAYGKRCKIHLVHFGGGVSGHIKMVPKFMQWVKDGYKVYTDTSWAIGFGARWLLVEIEKQGIGGDRVIFGSDEPWSDFMGEYWKIEGAPVSEQLKRMVLQGELREAAREALVSTTDAVANGFDIKTLAVELQTMGVRTREPVEGRQGGAGPSDAGFVWIDGAPLTVPVNGDYVSRSPYELVMHSSGKAGRLLRDGVEVGPVHLHARPKIYDLETADGIPYWKIALMHLDSLASTVFQRCVYWGTDEQCHFCAIGTSLVGWPHDPPQDPRAAGRGGRGRGPAGRRQGRHAHHRDAQPRRPRGLVHGPLRRGDPGGQRPSDPGAAGAPERLLVVRDAQGQRRRVARPAPGGVGRGRAARGWPRASTPRAARSTSPRGSRPSRSSGAARSRPTSSSGWARAPSR